MEGAVPREWRQARILPIPKVGKDKQRLASYRPIVLTSHIGKLEERMVLAKLTYLMERERMVPAEHVGFRARRSVEDNISRLVQQVQGGWNITKSHRKQIPDAPAPQNMFS